MTDIEIARSTKLEEIEVVASKYGIPAKELEHYGHYMAKVPTRLIDEERVKNSNLILVSHYTDKGWYRQDYRYYRSGSRSAPHRQERYLRSA